MRRGAQVITIMSTALIAGIAFTHSIVGCHSDDAPSVSNATQAVSSCICYNKTNPANGAVGRLFVENNGDIHHESVLYEDPATQDVYHWKGIASGASLGWERYGGPARSYAIVTAGDASTFYRLAGDARLDRKGSLDPDEFTSGGAWTRFGVCTNAQGTSCTADAQCPAANNRRCLAADVARDLFASGKFYYTFGPALCTDHTEGYPLNGNAGLGTKFEVDCASTSDAAATSYAGDSAGGASLYKHNQSGVFKYTNHCSATTKTTCLDTAQCPTGESCDGSGWVQIGDGSNTAIYSADGTVFARSTSGVVRMYNKATSGWDTPDNGAGISKVTGNGTEAWALAQGSVYHLADNKWSQISQLSSVVDIVGGPGYLYVLKTDGSILQWNGTSSMDISCSGAAAPGCANGCEPGPTPTLAAPSYSDAPETTQNSATNASYDVVTQHNDNARTGAQTSETILTPSSLASQSFGYLGSVPIPGKIYAQPLYVHQAAVVCNGAHNPPGLQNANIAYVATLENQVFAVDVDRQTLCWSSKTLGCPQPTWAPGSLSTGLDGAPNSNFDLGAGTPAEGGPVGVRVGLVGTPVIDRARDVLYAMARVRDGDDARGRYFLNVINTRTGELVSKVEAIADTLNGRNDCGKNPFHPSQATNRVGLLLVGSSLYTAFAANSGERSDADYHGNVLAFDVLDPAHPRNLDNSFCATPTSDGGGIWMSGNGLASDGSSIFFTTGNGAYRTCSDGSLDRNAIKSFPLANNFPDSVVSVSKFMSGHCSTTTTKQCTVDAHCPVHETCTGISAAHTDTRLDVPNLYSRITDCYDSSSCVSNCTPGTGNCQCNARTLFWARERSDADLGSGGVLVLPKPNSLEERLIAGGKDGHLYVIDPSSMTATQDFQAFVHNFNAAATSNFDTDYYYGPNIHGSPVAWNASSTYTYVYAWSEKDHLKRFRYHRASQAFDDATPEPDATMDAPLPTVHGDLISGAGLGVDLKEVGAMPGAMLSISADGSTPGSGIVWAVVQEPYKNCTKTRQSDSSWKYVVDQPVNDASVTVDDGGTPISCTSDPDCGVGGTCVRDAGSSTGICQVGPFENSGCNVLSGYVPGRLYAFATEPDASNRLRLLWGDTISPVVATPSQAGDTGAMAPGTDPPPNNYIPAYSKFAPPTIAHGKVLIATANNELRIYGLGSTHAVAHPEDPPRLQPELKRSDLVATPPPGGTIWTTLPVARSDGTDSGRFSFSFGASSDFPMSAGACAIRWDGAVTYPTPLSGDFNGDGATDLVLLGSASFTTTLPIALSNHDGTFAGGSWTLRSADPQLPDSAFSAWATGAAMKIVGHFGNALGSSAPNSDIALVGDPTFCTIPIAFGNPGTGVFTFTNKPAGDFTGPCSPPSGGLAGAAGVILSGDFDGDGRTDLALLAKPNSGWHRLPVAFSNGDGTFYVTEKEVGGRLGHCSITTSKPCGQSSDCGNETCNLSQADPVVRLWPAANTYSGGYAQFALWSTLACMSPTSRCASALVGDFNGDGRSDIALVGGQDWSTIPVAFSGGRRTSAPTGGGDGSFRISNVPFNDHVFPALGPFTSQAQALDNRFRVVGDFNGDGRADIALLDGSDSIKPIWVAFSNGDGTFRITHLTYPLAPAFATWIGGARSIQIADFDRDGSADIALVGAPGWRSIPVAFSNGDGTFRIRNVTDATGASTFNDDTIGTGSCSSTPTAATVLPGRY